MRRLSDEGAFAEKRDCVLELVLFGEVVDICEKLFPWNVDERVANPG